MGKYKALKQFSYEPVDHPEVHATFNISDEFEHPGPNFPIAMDTVQLVASGVIEELIRPTRTVRDRPPR